MSRCDAHASRRARNKDENRSVKIIYVVHTADTAVVETPLAIFYCNKRQVYYSKRLLACGRCFEIYYGKEASPAETSYSTFNTYRVTFSAGAN